MINIIPAFITLILAATFVLLELLTSEYPATYPLLLRSSTKLYIYSGIYGIIGFGVALILNALSNANVVSLEGPGLSNPWIRASLVGISIKAFLHIRLFSVGSPGGQQFPIGIETLVQLFEPWLLRGIVIDHFNAVRKHIEPRAKEYTNLKEVKKLIKNNIPVQIPDAEKSAFTADVNNVRSVVQAMELFISFLGVRTFDLVFPPRS